MAARWMYWGTLHKAQLVNGYSGFFPANHKEFRLRANNETLERYTLQDFANFQVRYIVVARQQMDDPFAGQTLPENFRVEKILTDEPAGIVIYRFDSDGVAERETLPTNER